MDAIDLIKDLRVELDGLKSKGLTTFTIKALEGYLAAIEVGARNKSTSEEALANARHEWEVQAPLQHATALEVFKSAITAGGDALRALILINGGAAVALLAFLGNILTRELRPGLSIPNAKVALGTFVFGVGFAGVSMAARYLTQLCAANGWTTRANWFTGIAILLGILSLGAFFRGGLWAYWSFT